MPMIIPSSEIKTCDSTFFHVIPFGLSRHDSGKGFTDVSGWLSSEDSDEYRPCGPRLKRSRNVILDRRQYYENSIIEQVCPFKDLWGSLSLDPRLAKLGCERKKVTLLFIHGLGIAISLPDISPYSEEAFITEPTGKTGTSKGFTVFFWSSALIQECCLDGEKQCYSDLHNPTSLWTQWSTSLTPCLHTSHKWQPGYWLKKRYDFFEE